MKKYAFHIAVLRQAASARLPGYLDAVLAAGEVQGEGDDRLVVLNEEQYVAIAKQFSNKTAEQIAAAVQGQSPTFGGPGTELKTLLKKIGIESTPTCKCNAMALQMDQWGADECSRPERIDEVLAAMRTEAAKRGLPFLDAAGRVLIRRAIANARKLTPQS